MNKVALLAVVLLLMPVPGLGGEGGRDHEQEARSAIAALSPGLQQLFSSEMLALQAGMMEMVPLYVAGKLQEIAVIAGNMEDSLVLKKNLTRSQMHELHTKLPASFLAQDRQFHYLAGMLEHVAEAGKIELVGFYIAKMGEACVACHSTYAANRFPNLAPDRQSESDHH